MYTVEWLYSNAHSEIRRNQLMFFFHIKGCKYQVKFKLSRFKIKRDVFLHVKFFSQ